VKLELGGVEGDGDGRRRDSCELETNQSVLSQTMDKQEGVAELPLERPAGLHAAASSPSGTLFTQQTFGATGFSGTRAWDVNGSVTIHGSRTGNNEFLIDGASNAGTGGWSYAPPVDAIEEFKVDTASTDASYGRTSGGVVNLTLKSGTNELHGSARRSSAAPRSTRTDPEHAEQHLERGAQVRRRRGDGQRPDQARQDLLHGRLPGLLRGDPVPVDDDRADRPAAAGDFSQTFNAQGNLIQIFDPLTTTCNAQACARGPRSRQQDPGQPHQPGRGGAAGADADGERRGHDHRQQQLHRLAEPRPLPLQLVPDAARSLVQPDAAAVVQQQRQLGIGAALGELAAAAGAAQRQLADASQPLPGDRRPQPDRRPRRSSTRACRSIGSTSRIRRNSARSAR
jgi:hypothetical protein